MKKWKICLLIAVLLVVIFFIRILPIYDSFSQRRTWNKAVQEAEQLPAQITDVLEAHADRFQTIADTMIRLWEEEDISISYTFETKKLDVSYPTVTEYDNKDIMALLWTPLNQLVPQTNMAFSKVFCVGEDPFYYPSGSCVFRYQIMAEDDVYRQIDLIYSTNWEQHKQNNLIHDPMGNDLAQEIAQNWCIVVLEPH